MENIKKMSQKVKKKQKMPVFRGRFGKRKVRSKNKEKWDKWRRPRGIDINLRKDDGAIPKIGYGRAKTIKHLHPSGRKIIYISNLKEMEKVKPEHIVIIKAGVGKRKRAEIRKYAEEKKIKITNKGKELEKKKETPKTKKEPKKEKIETKKISETKPKKEIKVKEKKEPKKIEGEKDATN